MTVSFRPAGSGDDAPMYAPQRDLAYLYSPLLKEAIRGLDVANWSETMKPWADAALVTDESLAETLKAFIDAHKLFTKNPEVKSAEEALERTGFFKCGTAERLLLYYRLGESVTAGVFHCVRAVTQVNCEPPMAADFEGIRAEAQCLMERTSGLPKPPEDMLRFTLAHHAEMLESRTSDLRNAKAQEEQLRLRLAKLQAELDARAGQLKTIGSSLLQSLKFWWQARRAKQRMYS